ncbi:MAG: hypothetical protein M1833_006607 [Piccolia ochrophora]|nr:MAG: hypothetical protein M1833_006607 [Piccolia ochrophora]
MLFNLLFTLLPLVAVAAPLTRRDASEVSYKDDANFQKAMLDTHNQYRGEHGAQGLTWDSKLASFAAAHASTCNFAHTGGEYGENIAAGYGTAEKVVRAWGDERDKYDFNNQGFSSGTGHFTQVVWQATQNLGCGRAFCEGKGTFGWYTVCEYSNERGNVSGQFDANVKPKGSKTSGSNPTVTQPSVTPSTVNKPSAKQRGRKWRVGKPRVTKWVVTTARSADPNDDYVQGAVNEATGTLQPTGTNALVAMMTMTMMLTAGLLA